MAHMPMPREFESTPLTMSRAHLVIGQCPRPCQFGDGPGKAAPAEYWRHDRFRQHFYYTGEGSIRQLCPRAADNSLFQNLILIKSLG